MVDPKPLKSTDVIGVLLGECGTGKSTVFNKITGHNVAASDCDESLTITVSRAFVANSTKLNFYIYDTPGIGAGSNRYHHSHMLRKALTSDSINAIFALIRYDDRVKDNMEN